MKDIQYDELMEKVLQDIKERQLTYSGMDFSEIALMIRREKEYHQEEFDSDMNMMKTLMNVRPYVGFYGGVLARSVKTIIKKFTTFFHVPAVTNQNAYNNINAEIVCKLYDQMAKQKDIIKELQLKLEICEKELNSLKTENRLGEKR